MGDVLFLVDGYNVTRSDPATRDLPLDRQRDALVSRLSARAGVLLGRGRVCVVFDGRGSAGSSAVHGAVEVRYTSGSESADDMIVRLAAAAGESVTIVSDDRELATRARAHAGARAVKVVARESVFEAAAPARSATRPSGRDLGGSTAGIPRGANRITEELKGLWLDEEDASRGSSEGT